MCGRRRENEGGNVAQDVVRRRIGKVARRSRVRVSIGLELDRGGRGGGGISGEEQRYCAPKVARNMAL